MAQTVTQYGSTMTIDFADSSDVVWSQISANPVKIASIFFMPGAANDKLIIRDGSISGPKLVTLLATDTEGRNKVFTGGMKSPCIDYSECTITAGAYVTIELS